MSIDDEPNGSNVPAFWRRLSKTGKMIFTIGLLLSTANGLRADSLATFIDGLVVTLLCVWIFG